LLSGGTGKALQQFGQDMGSQEYMNAFNRYQTERAARLNPLQSLTGMGQTTANTLGTAGQNYANTSGNIAGNMATNVGNQITSGAAARASGYVGSTNALTSGLNSYLNYNQGQNYLSALRGGGGLGGPNNFDPFNQVNF
jgi:phage-related minor tail protein